MCPPTPWRGSIPPRGLGSRRLCRADRAQSRCVGGDRGGPADAGGRADRLGQDAGGVPVVARPAARRAGAAGRAACACSTSRRSRRWPSTSSATCARRSPASAPPRSAWSCRCRRCAVGAAHRRHARRRAPALRPAIPPDILITTPESLYLLLDSAAREALRAVETVIVDEIHAVAGTKRGSHLALSLERLDQLLPQPAQRIGLSATVRPIDEVARFLGGAQPVTVVDAREPKLLEVARRGAGRRPDRAFAARLARFPAAAPPARAAPASIWPHVEERVLELIRAHRSTIVFANSRRLAERLCAPSQRARRRGADARPSRLGEPRAARRDRGRAEDRPLQAVVATSSLELGIDMGAVDLVIQIEAPDLGRLRPAAHRPRRPSGRRASAAASSFPSTAATCSSARRSCERMQRRRHRGAARAAQSARRARPADRRHGRDRRLDGRRRWRRSCAARRRSPSCPQRRSTGVLDMLAGRYPSDAFAGLRPRLTWDRIGDRLTARPGARLVGDHLRRHHPRPRPVRRLPRRRARHAGRRARRGDGVREPGRRRRSCSARRAGASRTSPPTGSSSRRRPASPGKMPFWRGDALGRPAELGRALGAFVRELARAAGRAAPRRASPPPAATSAPPPTCCATSTSNAPRPACCPTIAPWSSSASATRSATGACACTPSSAARVHAAVGAGDSRPPARPARRRRAGHPRRRRHRHPRARGRRAAVERGGVHRSGGDRGPRRRRARRLGAVRQPLPRVRGARAAAAASAAPASARRSGSSGSARRRCCRWRSQFPVLPDRPRDLPRVPAGRLRSAGAGGAAARRAQPRDPRGRGRDRAAVAVRQRRCSSPTSARSCTRAMRRSPSAAPRRWRSTAPCSPS